MNQSVNRLNELSANEAQAEFLKCCGSTKWAQEMTAARPFATEQELFTRADDISSSLEDEGWLEAFRPQPKNGEKKGANIPSQQEKKWAAKEPSGVAEASAVTISQ